MMTAGNPEITDELLSAYIDDAVTEAERKLIETAVASDPNIAWRLASLQETVRLLRVLPSLAAPRSFLLTPEQVRQGQMTVAAPPAPAPVSEGGGFWPRIREGWQIFWLAGSPAMRNAMAASFAVLLVLLIGPAMLQPTLTSQSTVLQTTADGSAVNDETSQIAGEYLTDKARAASKPPLQNAAASAVPAATSAAVLALDDASTQATDVEPTVMALAAEPPDRRIPVEEGSGDELGVLDGAASDASDSRSAVAEAMMGVAPTPAASLETQAESQATSGSAAEPADLVAMAVPASAAMAAPTVPTEMSAGDEQLSQVAPAAAPIAEGDGGAMAMAAPEADASSSAETSALVTADAPGEPPEEEIEAASAAAPFAEQAGVSMAAPELDAATTTEAFAIEQTEAQGEPVAADRGIASRSASSHEFADNAAHSHRSTRGRKD